MRHVQNPLISANQPYDPAKNLVEDSACGYYTRGTARCAVKQWEDGITDLEIAKQIDPEYAHAYWTLGVIYKARDKHRALQEFNAAYTLFRQQKNDEMARSAEYEASSIKEALNKV